MVWTKYDQNEFGTVRYISKNEKSRLKSIRRIDLAKSYSKVDHAPEQWNRLDARAKIEAVILGIRLSGKTIRVSSCSYEVGGPIRQIQGLPVSDVSAVVEAVRNELGSLVKVDQEKFQIFTRDHLYGRGKPIQAMLAISSTEIADFSLGSQAE